MALPSAVQYGQVAWRAVSAVADGVDADGDPDAVPVTGDVTFTPSAATLLAIAGPIPITVFATPVTYRLDSTGVLRDFQGRELLTLVATDSAGLTPTGWTWSANYRLNGGLVRGSFSFALPAGTVVDLTVVTPVEASGGVQIIQGPTGPKGDPGTGTTPAGPAGGALSGSYPNPGFNVAALDNAVAGRINDTLSATRLALDGAAGKAHYLHEQVTASASWAITHPFGRFPAIDLYVAGQQIDADIEVTATTASITFPTPVAGTAVLT